MSIAMSQKAAMKKELVGVDMYVYWTGDARDLGDRIASLAGHGLVLENLANKGLKAWPDADTSTMHLTDQYRCRFRGADGKTATHATIASLLDRAQQEGLDFTKTENLYLFDGAPGFTLGQGE